LQSHDQYEGEYRDGNHDFYERKALAVGFLGKSALPFQYEVEEGGNAASGGDSGGFFPKMLRSGYENEVENFEKTVRRKRLSGLSEKGSEEERDA
jgi:hypothetical protein